ncbi:SPOR domain-containing protein [uncultured Eudoraea sp.]|uniref:HU domain-containing protein n=1 Tax=uncultured Eudoraea sp. TaxID=1035614 RepID=UPI00262016C0|nr:SPOR domain-containing protein [uncultured Eudoraea sp.]
MGIEHYIQQLLYRYNCVVVPDFGAFLTQMKSAVHQKATNTFYPPSKQISFNEQLSSNDGLLVSYMANAENKSYEEMLKETLDLAKSWKKQLHSGERLKISSIGELWLNREGKLQFQPSNEINYLTSSYGLSSFVSPRVTREILKEQVVEMEEKIPFIITPEQRERKSFRPYLKYAAIILLALSTGMTAYRFYGESLNKKELVQQEAQTRVYKNIQEATFFNSKPLELPELKLHVTKKSVGNHHIIAGAFRIQENADKKVTQLRNKGYDATYLGVNSYGLHQVTYGSYENPEDALIFLRKIKRTESQDAWMLSTK